MAGGFGGEQQRQLALDRGLDGLAEIHHRAELPVAVIARGGAEPALREPARGERDRPQLDLGDPHAARAAVGAAAGEQPAPPVALLARDGGGDRLAELAAQLLGELPGAVQALLRAGVQRAEIDPLQQPGHGGGGERGGAQVALERPAERDQQPDRVE